jgi:hypothetical protein
VLLAAVKVYAPLGMEAATSVRELFKERLRGVLDT